MMRVKIKEEASSFAENKDKARTIRKEYINKALENNEEITIDFEGVEGATQSFIHALISQPIRDRGAAALEMIIFENCNDSIKKIIEIVADYMQESF